MLAFISIVAMMAAIVAGVGPAMFGSRSNSSDYLKNDSRTSTIPLVLLVAAGLAPATTLKKIRIRRSEEMQLRRLKDTKF